METQSLKEVLVAALAAAFLGSSFSNALADWPPAPAIELHSSTKTCARIGPVTVTSYMGRWPYRGWGGIGRVFEISMSIFKFTNPWLTSSSPHPVQYTHASPYFPCWCVCSNCFCNGSSSIDCFSSPLKTALQLLLQLLINVALAIPLPACPHLRPSMYPSHHQQYIERKVNCYSIH